MPYETLTVSREEGVAVVTLNRPAALNALNNQLREDLAAALAELRWDDSVQALVLTGGEGRAFSSGLDLVEFSALRQARSLVAIRRERWQAAVPLDTFDKPKIAAVNGLAIGGGVELALLCDIVIASTRASFAFAEVSRGVIPGNGGTQRLSRRVGLGRALDIILSARTVSAEQALDYGLVEQLAEPEALMPTALAYARSIARHAPVAVRLARSAIYRGYDLPLEAGLGLEADMASLAYGTEDAQEGPRAFVEKRPPKWRGC